jgi:hypothetical protein
MAASGLRVVMQFLGTLLDVETEQAGSPTVRFAACDLADDAVPILEAAVRYADGVVIDLAKISPGARTVRDAALVGRLSGAVSTVVDQAVIEQSDDATAVTIAGQPPATPALEILAGALKAPLLHVLRSHSLVVVLVDENKLDPDFAHFVWDLFAEHLAGVDLGAVRQIVLVSEAAAPNYDLHLRPRTDAAALLLFDERLTARATWREHLYEARQLLDTRLTVLFLAAGFSASSQPLPLGDYLRDFAVAEVVGHHIDGTPRFADYRQRLENHGELRPEERGIGLPEFVERLTFERVMHAELRHHNNRSDELPAMRHFIELHDQAMTNPGFAVRLLSSVVDAQREGRLKRNLVLVTVNFDELLERHCTGLRPIVVDNDFDGAGAAVEGWLAGTREEIPYLKLHGTISDPESLIISTAQTGLPLPEVKRGALLALNQLDVRWVYVGASMRDRDLRVTLSELAVDEDWVTPQLPRTVEEFCADFRHDRWERGTARRLPQRFHSMTADGFMSAFATEAGLI